jgi:hypothetical protein
VEEEAKEVEPNLSRQDLGGLAGIIVGCDLDQVHAHNLMGARDLLEKFQHLILEEPTVAGRAGSGRDRRAEAVNVDGDINPRTFGDALGNGLGTQGAELADRQDVVIHGPRGFITIFGGGGDIADANGGDAFDTVLFRRAPHRAAVADTHAVTFIHEIKMGVDLQDVDIAAAREGLDAGDIHRMIAADHHWQRAGFQDRLNPRPDIGMAFGSVGVDDVGVANIDDPH